MENRVISVGHLEQVYENKMKFPCADIYRKNKLCIDPKVAKHATRRALPNVSYCETFGVCVLFVFFCIAGCCASYSTKIASRRLVIPLHRSTSEDGTLILYCLDCF